MEAKRGLNVLLPNVWNAEKARRELHTGVKTTHECKRQEEEQEEVPKKTDIGYWYRGKPVHEDQAV